jgi:hypothetical protein
MNAADSGSVEFRLAPMASALRVMTITLFAIPALFIWLGLVGPPALLVLGVLLLLGFAATWLWLRPRRFVVSREGIRIDWPLRSATVPVDDILDARVIYGADFRREYGLGMRIGVGGLWGAFGRLKTRKGTFTIYISRLDELVLVGRKSGRPLLITPREPSRFVSTLEGIVARH